MRSRRGNTALEAVLFIPVLITLLVAMQQIGKLTYTYFTVKKIAYSAARYIATQQGVNICDSADPSIVAGLNFALTDQVSGAPIVNGLTADMFLVESQSYDPLSGTATTYDCNLAGYVAPDLIVVSIPGGYQTSPIIPHLTVTAVPLAVMVKVPYGGT